jgi:hypothetical protein
VVEVVVEVGVGVVVEVGVTMKRWNQPHRKALRREGAERRALERAKLIELRGNCGLASVLAEQGFTHTREYARVRELCSEGQ